MDDIKLEIMVSDMILEVAELYGEVTTSDLYRLAQVKAIKIIKMIRGEL